MENLSPWIKVSTRRWRGSTQAAFVPRGVELHHLPETSKVRRLFCARPSIEGLWIVGSGPTGLNRIGDSITSRNSEWHATPLSALGLSQRGRRKARTVSAVDAEAVGGP